MKNELSVVYFDCQFHNKSIQECVKLLKEFEDSKLLKKAYKLFRLVLTIPSTSVPAERNFSRLNYFKTYLRNSMTDEKLYSMATISIEKELIRLLTNNDEMFYLLKDRRIDSIYKKQNNNCKYTDKFWKLI